MFPKAAGAALAIALVVGCAGSRAATSGSPDASPLTIAAVAGEYVLVTVDGHALPHAPRATTPVVSGSFLLNSNGTFRLQTTYGAPDNTNASTGTCYTEGDELKMVWDGGGLTSMTLRSDTVLLKREGAVYGYLRGRRN